MILILMMMTLIITHDNGDTNTTNNTTNKHNDISNEHDNTNTIVL